jgi:hypothetical protein
VYQFYNPSVCNSFLEKTFAKPKILNKNNEKERTVKSVQVLEVYENLCYYIIYTLYYPRISEYRFRGKKKKKMKKITQKDFDPRQHNIIIAV